MKDYMKTEHYNQGEKQFTQVNWKCLGNKNIIL